MQPQPQKKSNLDFIIIVLVVIVIAAAAYYFLVIQRKGTEEQATKQKFTEQTILEDQGEFVEVPIEHTMPRQRDPVTGEYLEIQESGEKVEVFLPKNSVEGVLNR